MKPALFVSPLKYFIYILNFFFLKSPHQNPGESSALDAYVSNLNLFDFWLRNVPMLMHGWTDGQTKEKTLEWTITFWLFYLQIRNPDITIAALASFLNTNFPILSLSSVCTQLFVFNHCSWPGFQSPHRNAQRIDSIVLWLFPGMRVLNMQLSMWSMHYAQINRADACIGAWVTWYIH